MSTRDLRELAESATPGPWGTGDHGPIAIGDFGWVVTGVGPEYDVDSDQGRADAEFIAAANPQRVLALLDDLASAEARVADLEAKARALLDAMTRFGPGDSGQLWDAAQALRALVGDETPGTGDGA